MKSFIVPFIETILSLTGHFSLFSLVRKIFKKYSWPNSYIFVDTWVLAHLLLSFAVLYVFQFVSWKLMQWILLAVAAQRVIEMVTYQLNVLLVDQFHNPNYALGGYRRILILSIMNYIEMITWFGTFYYCWSTGFKDTGSVLSSPTGSLYFSLVTISTLGYGEVTPINNGTRALVILQILVGIFLLLLIISRVLSYLPKPHTLDKNENPKS